MIVNPKNTSRTCSCCGFTRAESRKIQTNFKCVECGFEENADLVGSTNTLKERLAQLACEVNTIKVS